MLHFLCFKLECRICSAESLGLSFQTPAHLSVSVSVSLQLLHPVRKLLRRDFYGSLTRRSFPYSGSGPVPSLMKWFFKSMICRGAQWITAFSAVASSADTVLYPFGSKNGFYSRGISHGTKSALTPGRASVSSVVQHSALNL